MPTRSATNTGLADVADESAAALPVGLDMMTQRWVRGSRLASVLLVPSNVTAVPTTTFWFTPALAIGSELAPDTVTVVAAAGLSTLPSFTMREAT